MQRSLWAFPFKLYFVIVLYSHNFNSVFLFKFEIIFLLLIPIKHLLHPWHSDLDGNLAALHFTTYRGVEHHEQSSV